MRISDLINFFESIEAKNGDIKVKFFATFKDASQCEKQGSVGVAAVHFIAEEPPYVVLESSYGLHRIKDDEEEE